MKINVNNEARRIDRAYIGVNGIARRVDRIYIGVNGVAREVIFGGFDRNDTAEANFTLGEIVAVQLKAVDIEDFRDTVMSLRYDRQMLSFERVSIDMPVNADLDIQANPPNAQIVSQVPGRVDFKCIREMRDNHDWSGFVIQAHFRALATGTTNIELS